MILLDEVPSLHAKLGKMREPERVYFWRTPSARVLRSRSLGTHHAPRPPRVESCLSFLYGPHMTASRFTHRRFPRRTMNRLLVAAGAVSATAFSQIAL